MRYLVIFLLLAVSPAFADPLTDLGPLMAAPRAHTPWKTLTVDHWNCAAIGSANITPGTGYAPGRYVVPLEGGTGKGAWAAVTIGSGGGATEVDIEPSGQLYSFLDTLTAPALPGGTGFLLTVDAVVNSPRDAADHPVLSNEMHVKWPPSPCVIPVLP